MGGKVGNLINLIFICLTYSASPSDHAPQATGLREVGETCGVRLAKHDRGERACRRRCRVERQVVEFGAAPLLAPVVPVVEEIPLKKREIKKPH